MRHDIKDRRPKGVLFSDLGENSELSISKGNDWENKIFANNDIFSQCIEESLDKNHEKL